MHFFYVYNLYRCINLYHLATQHSLPLRQTVQYRFQCYTAITNIINFNQTHTCYIPTTRCYSFLQQQIQLAFTFVFQQITAVQFTNCHVAGAFLPQRLCCIKATVQRWSNGRHVVYVFPHSIQWVRFGTGIVVTRVN